ISNICSEVKGIATDRVAATQLARCSPCSTPSSSSMSNGFGTYASTPSSAATARSWRDASAVTMTTRGRSSIGSFASSRITDHQLGVSLRDLRQCLDPVVGREDLVSLRVERELQDPHHLRLVVHDQDPMDRVADAVSGHGASNGLRRTWLDASSVAFRGSADEPTGGPEVHGGG